MEILNYISNTNKFPHFMTLIVGFSEKESKNPFIIFLIYEYFITKK